MAERMTYQTNNPVGSVDVRDLYDNAQNLDDFSNGPLDAYPDRFGVSRQSLQGIRNASQYVNLGPYAAGLNFTALNQVFSYDAGSGAEFYAPGPAITLPYTTTGAGAGEIANFRSVGDAVLRQDLANDTDPLKGSGMVGFDPSSSYSAGTVGGELLAVSAMPMVLRAATDGSDVTAQVVAFFAEALASGRNWFVPAGDYTIDPGAPIVIKTSGFCAGRFLVPKANQNFRFDILRDVGGTVVSTAGWLQIQRGKSDINAANAAGKNLLLASTEIQIERIGSGGSPYRKEEFIRCAYPGFLTTPPVNTYNSYANLTVTAHDPSRPITVSGLSVLLTGATGGTESNRGSIVVTRDNVTLNAPSVINQGAAQPRPVAIEVSYCADVVINRPSVAGFNFPGLGYGILNGSTIGLVVNDADLRDCRHAYTGAYTVDVTLNRGSYSRVIDDHWTDRFTANSPKVYANPGSSAFEFAGGGDITINDPVVSGGRSLFGIRTDTPSLGGKVIIRNPIIHTRGESGYYFLFGFSSPEGVTDPGITYTNKPKLPDYVEISSPSIDSDTVNVYGAFLGMLYFPHTTWGVIALRGKWATTGSPLTGVFAYKNATHQQDRTPRLDIDADIDCGLYNIAYVVALDSVTTRAFNVNIGAGASGSMRYNGASVGVLRAVGAGIRSIDLDGSAVAPAGFYAYTNCTFMGGNVSATHKNHVISSSIFSGSYGTFPIAADITLDGNVRAGSGITGLPADIRNNIALPFVS